ncbi:MAG: AAA family ATPase [Prevotellaceae bacterium]|jgi:hypothetical protein|nr:AAA family ATPase [Prevotellaceae bacterium]
MEKSENTPKTTASPDVLAPGSCNPDSSKLIVPDFDNETFRTAVDFVNNTYQHIFLTGKAGTGKTTFLKYIRQNSPKCILVAAPTGVAAINAGGVTLHSLFQLSFEPYIPGTRFKKSFTFSKQKRDLIQHADLLVIDEVSMLRADLLDSIDATLRYIRRDTRNFGGIQMLYIGDMFQLPPVVKDGEWELLKEYYQSPFFFHSKAFAKTKPVYLELKKVYRQREREFVDLLNRVRNNELAPSDFAKLNERYRPDFAPPSEGEKYIVLCTHNYKADNINTEKLAALEGKMHSFEGEVKGDFPDYSLPTDRELQLKVGAQIMFIKNDLRKPSRYYNGKIAEVTRIENDEIYARPEGQNEDFKIEKEVWRNVRYKFDRTRAEIEEEELGSFKQFPVRTAWAITIHKSQGLTFERAVIDAGQAFAAGQTYVALSRCTSLDGVILRSPIKPDSVQTNEHAVGFARSEPPADALAKQLESAKNQYKTEHFLRFFDFTPLMTLLNNHNRLTEYKVSDELISAHELSEELCMRAAVLRTTANRFSEQLRLLINAGDKERLKERCSKAVDYFISEINKSIILPLQNHKNGFSKKKRAKAYWTALNELENDIIFFANRLLTIRYDNELMVENIQTKAIKN